MRQTPPSDFNLTRFFEGIYTFQGWEIFPGHKTKGKDVVALLADMGVPASLQGKRVLDIAPWNGFFSFECARRGASEVVSFGPDDPEATGYNRVRDLLEAENCKYIRGSVYDLSPDVHGTFDVVFFLGLIYHLRHPLLALDKIYDVARSDLYADTPIMDRIVFDKTLSEEQTQQFSIAVLSCIKFRWRISPRESRPATTTTGSSPIAAPSWIGSSRPASPSCDPATMAAAGPGWPPRRPSVRLPLASKATIPALPASERTTEPVGSASRPREKPLIEHDPPAPRLHVLSAGDVNLAVYNFAATARAKLRIIVFKLDHFGDFIIGLPSLHRLRRLFADGHITLVCGS